jgi:hypothetical protein
MQEQAAAGISASRRQNRHYLRDCQLLLHDAAQGHARGKSGEGYPRGCQRMRQRLPRRARPHLQIVT